MIVANGDGGDNNGSDSSNKNDSGSNSNGDNIDRVVVTMVVTRFAAIFIFLH